MFSQHKDHLTTPVSSFRIFSSWHNDLLSCLPSHVLSHPFLSSWAASTKCTRVGEKDSLTNILQRRKSDRRSKLSTLHISGNGCHFRLSPSVLSARDARLFKSSFLATLPFRIHLRMNEQLKHAKKHVFKCAPKSPSPACGSWADCVHVCEAMASNFKSSECPRTHSSNEHNHSPTQPQTNNTQQL